MLMPRAIALLLVGVFCWPLLVLAQVAVPPLTGRVIDQTSTLSGDQKAALEQTLQTFEAQKGSQIAIVIVPTTEPETIEQFALRVAEQWKLGRNKVDDGAILVVAKDDRALRIEVGYGLEGALNDATSKRIISETIVPRFKQGDFFGGIQAGITQILRVIDGESLPAPKVRSAEDSTNIQQFIPIIFIFALVVGGMLRAVLGRLPGALVAGGVVALIAWFVVGTIVVAIVAGAITLFFTLFGGGIGGGMGGRGMGGRHGGFGTGGGGGFRGGGGGFGGGGASGRW